MIPFQSHVIVGVAAALLAAGAAWKVQGWRHDAALNKAAEAARIAQAGLISAHHDMQKAWERHASMLAGQKDAALVALADIQQRPTTKVVYREKVVTDGQTTCLEARIGPEVFDVMNAAAKAADGAVPR